MSVIPQYNPPRYNVPATDLNNRLQQFFTFWQTFSDYQYDYINKLRNIIESGGNLGPFSYIASASEIKPLQFVQPITGSVTISTISTPPGFNKVTLLAIDGFSLDIADNIAAAVTVAAGDALDVYFNMKDLKWYPTGSRAGAGAGASGEIIVADGFCAPPIMITNETECDFIYADI